MIGTQESEHVPIQNMAGFGVHVVRDCWTPAGALTLLAPKLPPEAAYWMGGLPSLEQLAEEHGAER